MHIKNTAGPSEFAAITFFAFILFVPFLSVQYDTNGIVEAQSVESGDLFHKNHMLYRPFGYVVYRSAMAGGYTGNSLRILQIINALSGALGVGLCYATFKYVLKDRIAALVGSFWLATSFTYWYFSTDAGYITLAGLFALGGMTATVYRHSLIGGTSTALSVLTWQASIFLLPLLAGRGRSLFLKGRRVRVAVATLVIVGTVYLLAGFFQGHRTPSALFTWISSYGEGGTLPLWGTWGWDRFPAAAVSALRSITPVLLAARPSDFNRHVQLGRIAVDLALIAFATLLVLAAVRANRTSLYFLTGYAVFLPFIIWWDPYEPKWFLIPNIFLAGFLASGITPWLQHKYARILVPGCVLVIAGTNFVTTIFPRHTELGPDRATAQCVAEKMTPKDLFVSAEWGWSEYLTYLHKRASTSVINESMDSVEDRVQETKNKGGSVYMSDPHSYSESHIRWLTDQTGVTLERLEKLGGSPSFTCEGETLVRL